MIAAANPIKNPTELTYLLEAQAAANNQAQPIAIPEPISIIILQGLLMLS
jgi:hypothetical protein